MKDEEFSIQARLKKIDEGFDDGSYYYAGKCDVCGGERKYYTNKYDNDFVVRVCADCDDGWECEGRPSWGHVGICPLCGELVRFETGDKDEKDYAICAEDDCGQMVHISCLAYELSHKNIIDAVTLSKKWLCEKHYNEQAMFRELRTLFAIPGFKLYRALRRKGVDYIYHSNTIRTSCTFLENRGLLSRGSVEDMMEDQTPQKSDGDDKQMGIWYDIFFDSVDIHHHLASLGGKGACINLYGPVLFKFRVQALLEPDILSKLKVTRTNPIYWKKTTGVPDFFSDASEVLSNFSVGQFGQHIVLHDCKRPLPFNHLEGIILDDPQITDNGVEVFSQTLGALRWAVRKGKTKTININRRGCLSSCICNTTYTNMFKYDLEKFNDFFIP